MKYFELTYDNRQDIQTIAEWEMGNFNLMLLWGGQPFNGSIPNDVKLFIREGDEHLVRPDLLPNPVSWLIFSEKLLAEVHQLIKNDIQIFEPPIYLKNGQKVKGYKLINPIYRLDCLDWENSKSVEQNVDGTKVCFGQKSVFESCIGNHHIFMIEGCSTAQIVSDTFLQACQHKGLIGLAGLKCKTSRKKV